MNLDKLAGIVGVEIPGIGAVPVVSTVSYNLGRNKREVLVGHSGVHGYKELPQIPFVEFDLRDWKELDAAALLDLFDITLKVMLANGKTLALYNAVQTGTGDGSSAEATFKVRFEGSTMDEIGA